MNKLIRVIVAVALTFLVVPSGVAAEEKNPYGAPAVDPAAPNESIFTVSKGAKKATFTFSQLKKMKTSKVTIFEPFVKKNQTFTVIPMKDFFKRVGISGSDSVSTVALNDYIFKSTAAKFVAANALIAIERNGVEIPYDQGGPVRLIFAKSSTWSKNLDAWNWSLASLTVK
jgi:hypothetical protein